MVIVPIAQAAYSSPASKKNWNDKMATEFLNVMTSTSLAGLIGSGESASDCFMKSFTLISPV